MKERVDKNMSYWYWRPLKTAWELDEATTNRLDMPGQGALSGLAIQTHVINVAAGLVDVDNPWPIQHHTKVRVVGNGNVEIVNTRAKYLQAMYCWDQDIDPDGYYVQSGGLYQRNFWYIPFGRYFGDMKYGLSLEKFVSGVQFEETNDISTSDYQDTYSQLEVYGLFYKNPGANMFPGGFLRKREIVDKDTAAATQYAVKLPTINRIKQIHIFSEPDLSSHLDATAATTNVQYVWLSVKSRDEYLINNMRSIDLVNNIATVMNRKFRTGVQVHAGATAGLAYADTMLYRRFPSTITPVAAAVADLAPVIDFGDRRIIKTWVQAAGSGVGGSVSNVLSQGHMLHGDIPLLIQDPMADETEWLDSNTLKDVYVEVTEGASSGDWRIVLDELEKGVP